ncbi:MFS transporter [Bordetella petrii]|uniref:MFS transporter n=1 Tax=Bordetella petrii TaxID=94624 RepID=UPI00048F44CC|nr:MFS transporter [Bordetella petrii]
MPPIQSRNRAIALLALAAFVSASAFRICDPMLPRLASEFGTSTGQAAATVTAFAIAYGLLQMFFGPVGDRYGKYRVVAVATFACAIGSAGAVLAPSLDVLVLCRALSGAAGAGIVPLSMAWIGDTVPYEERQATLARFLTGTILGMAAGQLAGGWFADTIGWRWAFGALVAGYLVVGLLLWREVGRQSADAAATTAPAAAPRQGFVAQVRTVLGVRWARIVLATVFIEGLLVFGTLAFAPAYLHERFGLSLTAAGAAVAVYALGGLMYTLVAGPVLRRLGERGLANAGGLVLCAAFATYLFGPAWGWSLLASILAGFGYYLLHATLQTHATQMVPSARGTAVAWFASCLFLGQAVGVALAGLVVDAAGAAALFGAAAVLLPLLGGSFAWALRRRLAASTAR